MEELLPAVGEGAAWSWRKSYGPAGTINRHLELSPCIRIRETFSGLVTDLLWASYMHADLLWAASYMQTLVTCRHSLG